MKELKIFQSYIPQLIAYEQAWTQFVRVGEIDSTVINPVIAESWKRCRELGLNSLACEASGRLSEEELNERLAKKADLINTALSYMEILYNIVKDSGFRIDLYDEEGYLLKMLADEEIMFTCAKTQSTPGACRREEVAGTNSISVVLNTLQPIQIAGGEHYAQFLHRWTCSAAPILNSKGKLIGILNMAGSYEFVHKHTLGMVVASARAIENQLRVKLAAQQLARNNNQLKTTLTTISDGLLYINTAGRITQVNKVAEDILGLNADSLLGRVLSEIMRLNPPIENVLKTGQGFADREMSLSIGCRTFHCFVTLQPVLKKTKQVEGLVVILKKTEHVRKLVNKMVGAAARFSFNDIVGENIRLREAIGLAQMAARTNSRIIIEGESGTGKELFAQAIHNSSMRSSGPFIAVNCGALPRELIESELFGYEEGAFTGAKKGGQPGKFVMAEGGTLFLDEVGDMPLDMQVKILRVLQENQVVRIGGQRAIPVDVRVIAATNKSLEQEVKNGNFREDLYYRLNVVKITVPPLRERPDDIPILANYFIRLNSLSLGKMSEGIEDDVLPLLAAYQWPGNIRELQNVIERSIIVAKHSKIEVDDLPETIRQESVMPVLDADVSLNSLEDYEKNIIYSTLNQVNGNISQAAKILKIGRNTLYRKIEKFDLKSIVS